MSFLGAFLTDYSQHYFDGQCAEITALAVFITDLLLKLVRNLCKAYHGSEFFKLRYDNENHVVEIGAGNVCIDAIYAIGTLQEQCISEICPPNIKYATI